MSLKAITTLLLASALILLSACGAASGETHISIKAKHSVNIDDSGKLFGALQHCAFVASRHGDGDGDVICADS